MMQWYAKRRQLAARRGPMQRELETMMRDMTQFVGSLDDDPVTGQKPVAIQPLSDGSGFSVVSIQSQVVKVSLPPDSDEATVSPPIKIGDITVGAVTGFDNEWVWTRPEPGSTGDESQSRRTSLMEALIVATLR